jgi:hypothetical protein
MHNRIDLQISSLCDSTHPVTSSPLGVHTVLTSMSQYELNRISSPRVRHQFLYPCYSLQEKLCL